MSVYLLTLPSFTWTKVNEVMMYHSCPHAVTIRVAHGGKEDSVVIMPYLSHGGEWMVRGAPGSRFSPSAFQVAPGTRIRTVAAQPITEDEMDQVKPLRTDHSIYPGKAGSQENYAVTVGKTSGPHVHMTMDGTLAVHEEGLCGDELVELGPPGYSDGEEA